MQTAIKWHQGVCFTGQTPSGHLVTMDGPPDVGGQNLGPRPMEMLLLGLGGCSAFDVVTMLQKSRQAILDCIVTIDAQRADTPPKIYTQIHIHFAIYGKDLSEKKISQAIERSISKYCSASIMLGKSAKITHDFTMTDGPAPKALTT